ncbi:SGNH/GDSL hydrolase family protein [Legionella brunensis]|uniref:Putative thermolabile hemolysin n=1 Tax=Legionella brunensis TaxID=29422 RepID=A0A0W0SK76_9GAMM|nr:SGNH/GDSL hydrolase family protein [Legionella brunensis]KTC83766.1 putative thermolabile hemolysin [Legionella brunensis]
MPKPKIEYIVSMGDSLSDPAPGTMDHRKLFGIIPMDGLSGLKGNSPKGAFTNGDVWITDFGLEYAEKDLAERGKITLENLDKIRDLDLASYRRIDYKGQDFVRYYDEGGLTSYNYSGRITANLKLLATEEIVSTLDQKRDLLFADDKARGITEQHKKHTLVVEWSGANDLITVNSKPTEEEAKKAVEARLHNVKELIKKGYRHFALFNLPDLSLTPHFQALSKKEQENAKKVCLYFNRLLEEGMKKLSEEHEDCSLNVFDVNKFFTQAYENPEKFGLDPAKLHKPFIESEDFKKSKTYAPGYMFWDDKHPTARVHELLAENFYSEYEEKYHFTAPHESLITLFRENYGQRWEDDMNGWFGFFRQSNLPNYKSPHLQLTAILKHALYEGGDRTRDTIIHLGWINSKNELISNNPALVSAWEMIMEKQEDNSIELSAVSLFNYE